ncbi:hypothetical protein D9M73_174840 [compost metagenome]
MGTRKVSKRKISSGRISAWDFRRFIRSARARRCLRLGPATSFRGTAVAMANSVGTGLDFQPLGPG